MKHPQEGARSKVHVTAAHSPKEGSQLTKLAELGHFLCAASTTTTTTSTTTSKHFRILDMCSLTCGRRISAMRIASHMRFFLRHKARRRLWRWQGELVLFECDAEILRPQQKQIRFPQKNSRPLTLRFEIPYPRKSRVLSSTAGVLSELAPCTPSDF